MRWRTGELVDEFADVVKKSRHVNKKDKKEKKIISWETKI